MTTPDDVVLLLDREPMWKTQCVLTINGGSSSIRFAVHEAAEMPRRRLTGKG